MPIRQWLLRGTSSNDESGRASPLAIAASLSLSIGFLDVLAGMLSRPSGLSSFSSVLRILSPTVAVVFLVYASTWFLLARVGKAFRLEAAPLALSFAAWWGTVFTLEVSGISWRPPQDKLIHLSLSLVDSFRILVMLSMIVVFSVGAYRAVKGSVRKPEFPRYLDGLFLVAPLVLGETVVFVWLDRYKVGSFGVLASVVTTAGCLLLVLLTIRYLYRFGHRLHLGKLLAAWGALVVLIPAGTVFLENRSDAPVGGFGGRDPEVKRVILITVDTLRADSLSSYGQQNISTPHIDQLARDGVLFRTAVSTAPWTLPSLASIMAGLSPDIHMAIGDDTRVPDAVQTLAEYLRDEGYVTAAFGSNPFLGSRFNLSQGFHEYHAFPKPSLGASFGARLLKQLGVTSSALWPVENIATGTLTELAVDWVEANREKNFFLWVHYLDPHTPYAPPSAFLPSGGAPEAIGTSFSMSEQILGGHFTPSLQERDWIRRLYNAEVRYVDQNIGVLLDTFKQLGMYDDSLIIFTSDHGEEFFEHGGNGHGHSLYNELLRVPLIFKLPHSATQKEIRAPVATPSIMPTVLDVCRIPYDPSRLSFVSLVPLWEREPQSFQAEPIVSTALQYFENRDAVTFDGLKYIRFRESAREELYDLAADPWEQNSLILSLPEKMTEARDILEKHIERLRYLRKVHGLEVGQKIELDEETRERLKALGYIQ